MVLETQVLEPWAAKKTGCRKLCQLKVTILSIIKKEGLPDIMRNIDRLLILSSVLCSASMVSLVRSVITARTIVQPGSESQ